MSITLQYLTEAIVNLDARFKEIVGTGTLSEKMRLDTEFAVAHVNKSIQRMNMFIENSNPIYLHNLVMKTDAHMTPDFDKESQKESKDLTREELLIILNDIQQSLQRSYEIVDHWNKLQKFLDENETVKNEWNRFMMTMRLYGGDENEV